MRNLSLVLIFTVLILRTSTSLAGDVFFETDVKYKKLDQLSFESLKSGDSLKINPGDNTLIVTPRNVPLLLFSFTKQDSKVMISDANVTAAISEQLQPAVEKSTSEIIDGLRKADALIQKRDYNQAFTVINALKEKYKNISSIHFMSGTLAYLMNNKSTAIENLQKGLVLDPGNEPAKKLLEQLKGKS